MTNTTSSQNEVRLGTRMDVNPYAYMSKPKKVWTLTLEDGSEFSQYPTRNAAVQDAKKYKLVIVT